MKPGIARFRFFVLLGLLLGLDARGWADDHFPHPIDILPQNMYAPPGFDDNDNAQVVLQGNYISSCFRMGNPTAQVDLSTHRIFVRSRTLYYRSSWCLAVLVPYLQAVDVGVLPAGVYDVKVADTQGGWHSAARLSVAVSRSTYPDDFVYAPVTDVALDGDLLTLRGAFRDNCMSMADIAVLTRVPSIIEVLPKVNVARRPCATVMVPFEARVRLNPRFHGLNLIHVRTMNGRALNRVVAF